MLSGEEYLIDMYDEPDPSPRDREEMAALLYGGFPQYEKDPSLRGQIIIDPDWLRENMVMEWFPLIGQRYVNRAMVVPLYRALTEIASGPLMDYIKSRQCGIFCPRFIGWNSRRTLSFHALALAIDINWGENSYGKPGTIRGTGIVEVFKKYGFTWGGDWSTPDDMHFQYGHKSISIPRK